MRLKRADRQRVEQAVGRALRLGEEALDNLPRHLRVEALRRLEERRATSSHFGDERHGGAS